MENHEYSIFFWLVTRCFILFFFLFSFDKRSNYSSQRMQRKQREISRVEKNTRRDPTVADKVLV